MHIVLAVLCWVTVALPWQVHGEVLIVTSSQSKPYIQAIDGLNQVLGGVSYQGVQTIQQAESEIFSADSVKTDNLFNRKVKQKQAKVIVAVGSKALAAVAGLHLPIVYLMAANPDKSIPEGNTTITGISLLVDPEKQLAAIIAYLPTVKNLGIIYDPAKSAEQVASLARYVKKGTSLTLLTKEVSQAMEVGAALAKLATSVDALLLLPDTTVVTAVNLDIFSLYSLNNKKPVIAFAPQYLSRGVSLVIYSAPEAMGQQAGQMVLRLLAGKTVEETPPEASHTLVVQGNKRILQQLGIKTALEESWQNGEEEP